MKRIWIYTIAIAPFFAFKERIENQIGLPMFLLATLALGLAARAVAERFGK